MKENITAKELLDAIRDLHRAWMDMAPKGREINKSCFFTLKKIKDFKRENPDKIGITVKDLAKQSERTPAGISQKISSLEDMKLVERIFDKNDRRVVYFVSTKAGDDVYNKIHGDFERFTSSLLNELGEESAAETTRHIKKLCDVIRTINLENKTLKG